MLQKNVQKKVYTLCCWTMSKEKVFAAVLNSHTRKLIVKPVIIEMSKIRQYLLVVIYSLAWIQKRNMLGPIGTQGFGSGSRKI